MVELALAALVGDCMNPPEMRLIPAGLSQSQCGVPTCIVIGVSYLPSYRTRFLIVTARKTDARTEVPATLDQHADFFDVVYTCTPC